MLVTAVMIHGISGPFPRKLMQITNTVDVFRALSNNVRAYAGARAVISDQPCDEFLVADGVAAGLACRRDVFPLLRCGKSFPFRCTVGHRGISRNARYWTREIGCSTGRKITAPVGQITPVSNR